MTDNDMTLDDLHRVLGDQRFAALVEEVHAISAEVPVGEERPVGGVGRAGVARHANRLHGIKITYPVYRHQRA